MASFLHVPSHRATHSLVPTFSSYHVFAIYPKLSFTHPFLPAANVHTHAAARLSNSPVHTPSSGTSQPALHHEASHLHGCIHVAAYLPCMSRTYLVNSNYLVATLHPLNHSMQPICDCVAACVEHPQSKRNNAQGAKISRRRAVMLPKPAVFQKHSLSCRLASAPISRSRNTSSST